MRIAVIVTTFPALSETFVLGQITGLIDLGHEVDIFAAPSDDRAVHPDVSGYELLGRVYYPPWMPRNYAKRVTKAGWLILRRGLTSPMALMRCLNIWRYGVDAASLRLLYAAFPFLGRGPYDALLCHFGYNGRKVSRLRLVGAVRGRLITVFHGADMTRYLQDEGTQVYDDLFRDGDLFLPISDRWRSRLVELGCPEDKVVVHRMGIRCDRFSYREREIGQEKVVDIVSIARLVEKKGIEYAIRAIRALVPPIGIRIRYTVIGDGPLRASLSALIAELDLSTTVRLVGWKEQTEVMGYLDASHIFLAPSVTAADGDQEGIPVSLMEAMAMGLPVVSTLHSGIPELVEDGVSGLLVPERDVDALANRLDYLIRDAHLRMQIGRAARAKVEAQYDQPMLNVRLVELFQTHTHH